jgi:hypothetical protein
MSVREDLNMDPKVSEFKKHLFIDLPTSLAIIGFLLLTVAIYVLLKKKSVFKIFTIIFFSSSAIIINYIFINFIMDAEKIGAIIFLIMTLLFINFFYFRFFYIRRFSNLVKFFKLKNYIWKNLNGEVFLKPEVLADILSIPAEKLYKLKYYRTHKANTQQGAKKETYTVIKDENLGIDSLMSLFDINAQYIYSISRIK